MHILSDVFLSLMYVVIVRSSSMLAGLNLGLKPLGISPWNLPHLFIMLMHAASDLYIFAQGLCYGISKSEIRGNVSLNFERSQPSPGAKINWLRQHFVDLPLFFHSVKTAFVCGNLKSMKRGAFFQDFWVSKVITTAHADRRGVIYKYLKIAFKQ